MWIQYNTAAAAATPGGWMLRSSSPGMPIAHHLYSMMARSAAIRDCIGGKWVVYGAIDDACNGWCNGGRIVVDYRWHLERLSLLFWKFAHHNTKTQQRESSALAEIS